MDDLIRIVLEYLDSDEGPELCDEFGGQLGRQALLAVAQGIAEAIVAAGWPRQAS